MKKSVVFLMALLIMLQSVSVFATENTDSVIEQPFSEYSEDNIELFNEAPEITWELEGAMYIPLDTELSFNCDDELVESSLEVSVSENGEILSDGYNFDISTLTLSFDNDLKEFSQYTVDFVYNGQNIKNISFTTAFDTVSADYTISTYDNVSSIKDIGASHGAFTMKATAQTAAWIEGNRRYVFVDKNGDTTKWMRLTLQKNGRVARFYGTGEDYASSGQGQEELFSALDISADVKFTVTYVCDKFYIYAQDKSGVRYGVIDVSPKYTGFLLTHAAVSNGNIGPGAYAFCEPLTANAVKISAEKDSEIEVEFSSDLVSAPESVKIGEVDASVSYSGNTATFKLNGDLAYLKEYTINLSGFKDIHSQNAGEIKIITPKMEQQYLLENIVYEIDGEISEIINSGNLVVKANISKKKEYAKDNLIAVLALYEYDGKAFTMFDAKAYSVNDLEYNSAKPIIFEAITVPEAASKTYSVKLMLIPSVSDAFPLISPITKQ